MLLQLGLTLFSYTRHTGALSPLFSIERDLTEYEALFVLLEKTEFHSALLAGHRAHIAAGAAGGEKLRTIGAAVRLRHNPVAYAVAASLLLWDHHCAAAFARWKQIYGASLRGWFEAVACLEACVSLQLPALVRENVCFPEIVDTDEPLFRAEGMRHPLLAETDAVPNDAGLAHGTVIITGSNMSGKPLLRTIGLNMVLAYAGAPVCAAGLALSRMKLFTSMRVEDDVSRGISTFYAELLRIRAMVAYQKERKPMMALIDEIFKGTNSADRVVGATAAVKRLSSAWCLTLVSTHDFELCALESDPVIRARNFHFEESYQGDRICFDYRIKDGRCRTANARHLLRLVGILQDQPGQEGTG
ncbi:MAG: MutS-related protein [Hydrogeniiclostridium mannosilyticum]